jgi:hypothetical protein
VALRRDRRGAGGRAHRGTLSGDERHEPTANRPQTTGRRRSAPTPRTNLGGRDAVPGYGCKTPPSRLVPPSQAPKRPRAWGIVVRNHEFHRIRACRP